MDNQAEECTDPNAMKPLNTLTKLISIALAVAIGTFAVTEYQEWRKAKRRAQITIDTIDSTKSVIKSLLDPEEWRKAKKRREEAERQRNKPEQPAKPKANSVAGRE